MVHTCLAPFDSGFVKSESDTEYSSAYFQSTTFKPANGNRTQSGKNPLLGAAVISLGNPTDVISLPGLY